MLTFKFSLHLSCLIGRELDVYGESPGIGCTCSKGTEEWVDCVVWRQYKYLCYDFLFFSKFSCGFLFWKEVGSNTDEINKVC